MDQPDLFDAEAARSLLDQLLQESRLYRTSADYKELLDFVVRLRNFAPFNAMLLQVQKPGMRFAASARDWRERFGRTVREKARPLLILWPFAPVALVYDLVDTDGRPLPEDAAAFVARGTIDAKRLKEFLARAEAKGIECRLHDAGDNSAGSIRVVRRATNEKEYTQYRLHINRNHLPAVQLSTLAHELGHLFLGHMGRDRGLKVPDRHGLSHTQEELEAESVSYIVCCRGGVVPKSETYLAKYVNSDTTLDALDVFQVMRATGQVESLLGLSAHTKFEKPVRRDVAASG